VGGVEGLRVLARDDAVGVDVVTHHVGGAGEGELRGLHAGPPAADRRTPAPDRCRRGPLAGGTLPAGRALPASRALPAVSAPPADGALTPPPPPPAPRRGRRCGRPPRRRPRRPASRGRGSR